MWPLSSEAPSVLPPAGMKLAEFAGDSALLDVRCHGRHDLLRPRGAERRHPSSRAGQGGRAAGADQRLGDGAFLWGRDRASRALQVDRGAARGRRSGAGDGHQRVARGGRDALRAPGEAGDAGGGRAADVRPDAAAAEAAGRRAGADPAGGRRPRRRGAGGGGRRGADRVRPRHPERPQPGRLHALGGEAAAAGRAGLRARLLHLRGRPVPRAALRGRAAGDDALDGLAATR